MCRELHVGAFLVIGYTVNEVSFRLYAHEVFACPFGQREDEWMGIVVGVSGCESGIGTHVECVGIGR